ncbi:hypothetical protein, partial [Desulfovibrio sp. SGI.169]|uniref:hypothetical protein n=1 Tax=Desulfovibrio sp. SGI.169 TaxID=3420561 RepID=UPI003D0516A5
MNRHKNVLEVILELVSYALLSQNKYTFLIPEATNAVNEFYSFDFPDAVIKKTCNKMVSDKILSRNNQFSYSFVDKTKFNIDDADKVFTELHNIHKELCDALLAYANEKFGEFISENEDKDNIIKCLFDFVLYGKSNNPFHSRIVSSFLVSITDNDYYTSYLSNMRQALVLYQGICYSQNFNELGNWNRELSLFFNTDVLFSAYGLNGEYKKKLFDDFYQLASEININARNKKNRDIIKFYYFDQVKTEIDDFYYVASLVVQNKVTLNPDKKAMISIVNGCNKESNVLEKKAKFFSFLKNKNINLVTDIPDTRDYIVESSEIIKKLEQESIENNKPFDNNEVALAFTYLTLINAYRKGHSDCAFHSAKYFFVTDKSLTNYIATNPIVKFNEKDIPLATSIDFLTSKFWFSLNKSFSMGNRMITFDVIVRAKLVLESQLNDAIGECFNEIRNKIASGAITSAEAEQLYLSLREKS